MQASDVVEIRRKVHAHAELGHLEFHTASLIMDVLEGLGVPYKAGSDAIDVDAIAVPPSDEEYDEFAQRALDAGVPADRVRFLREEGTAVIAMFKGDRPGPVWGLRCDIDALPILESSAETHLPAKEGFRSTTGAMHACGHDGHVAIGLGLAARLAAGDFAGEVRILFQPAEEGVRGAMPMIAAGAAEGIERMHAIHLMVNAPLGHALGGASGYANTSWQAEYMGEPAHAAAAPEKGRHAIAAAAQATLGILGMSRFSTSDTRVNVGTLQASGAANIIPAAAKMTYQVRAEDNDVLVEMNRRAENIVHGAAQMYGVDVETKIYGSAPNSIPDEVALDSVERAAAKIPAITHFDRVDDGPVGSDDAHLFINEVQKNGGTGSYIYVGAQNNEAPHHHHSFDVDEAALPIAIDLLKALFCEER